MIDATMIETPAGPMSERELDYLSRLALGEPRKRIAARDRIARQTVDKVISGALDKLGTDSLIDAFRALGWLRISARGTE